MQPEDLCVRRLFPGTDVVCFCRGCNPFHESPAPLRAIGKRGSVGSRFYDELAERDRPDRGGSLPSERYLARRIKVFALTDGWCYLCGCCAAATIDHVVPTCAGGTNALSNLLGACTWCNHSKSDVSLQEFRTRQVRNYITAWGRLHPHAPR